MHPPNARGFSCGAERRAPRPCWEALGHNFFENVRSAFIIRNKATVLQVVCGRIWPGLEAAHNTFDVCPINPLSADKKLSHPVVRHKQHRCKSSGACSSGPMFPCPINRNWRVIEQNMPECCGMPDLSTNM